MPPARPRGRSESDTREEPDDALLDRRSSAPSVDLSPSELIDSLRNYALQNWTSGLALRVVIFFELGVCLIALGAFAFMVPLTFALGGFILYRDQGWQFFQAGKGGTRFVALQTVAWTTYGISLALSLVNTFLVKDFTVEVSAFGFGVMSWGLTVASLLVYQGPEQQQSKQQVAVPSTNELLGSVFNAELQLNTALMHSGEGVTDLWWVFIGICFWISAVGSWIGWRAELHTSNTAIQMLSTVVVLWATTFATTLTHAIGGQWRHVRTGYLAIMPGRGGAKFIALQFFGWSLFTGCQINGLASLALQAHLEYGLAGYLPKPVAHLLAEHAKPSFVGGLRLAASLCGFLGQIVIATSLFFYEASMVDLAPASASAKASRLLRFLRATHFLGLNLVFSGGKNYKNSRQPKVKGPEDWKQGEERFQQVLARAGGDKRTGDQYLIIGVGFVGKRLVQRLLDRGETKIRLFDITPSNPFAGNANVEYVRGDVTKLDQVMKACEGVQTVYSIFAIIRFMDRLEHQALLSYRINVGGTENVLKACLENNVQRLIVTSSSNATTDEHSQPRFNRDETAPYVQRSTAFNHYGWTKAAADALCLNANGSKLKNGGKLAVSIIRPCSGVFGGDDRHLMEKALELGVFPGIGAKALVDLVYVENVVLGHLLLEAALQCNGKVFGANVEGQAFNVSNNEPVLNEDFWFSVIHVMREACDPSKIKSSLDFVYIPEAPLWVISYLSELNQKIFKGKVSLGHDIDMMSPGMMTTATMAYTYNSNKAMRCLGYDAAYRLDEAIQKSLYDYFDKHYNYSATTQAQRKNG